jgi:hypothetical protein
MTAISTRTRLADRRAAIGVLVAGCVVLLAACGPPSRRRATPSAGAAPRILTVPQIEQMVQRGAPPAVIFGEMERSGTVYRLTEQQTEDLRAVGMPAALISQMELTYQHAIGKNPALATSGNYWAELDGYWYGGLPLGWPRDWVARAPAARKASR